MASPERLQRIARRVAIAAAAIGLAGTSGCANAGLPPDALVWLHPVLLALGVVTGRAAARRLAAIDRRRFEIVADPSLTSGEIREAHRHAESQRRWAALWLLGAPLLLGYALAGQAPEGEAGIAVHLLPVAGILGGVVGLFLGRPRE